MRNDYYNHQTLLVNVIVHTQREGGERERERERGREGERYNVHCK